MLRVVDMECAGTMQRLETPHQEMWGCLYTTWQTSGVKMNQTSQIAVYRLLNLSGWPTDTEDRAEGIPCDVPHRSFMGGQFDGCQPMGICLVNSC